MERAKAESSNGPYVDTTSTCQHWFVLISLF